MFSTGSQILLATSCLLNKMQNESNYFLSLPQITTTTKNPSNHINIYFLTFSSVISKGFLLKSLGMRALWILQI